MARPEAHPRLRTPSEKGRAAQILVVGDFRNSRPSAQKRRRLRPPKAFSKKGYNKSNRELGATFGSRKEPCRQRIEAFRSQRSEVEILPARVEQSVVPAFELPRPSLQHARRRGAMPGFRIRSDEGAPKA